MTIETAQIVYVVAPSGTGKSFTGDYMHVVHGYKHVDGDGPLKSCADPKYREMTIGILRHFLNEKDLSKEIWSPYFEEIAKQTVEAAKDHDKVVLTHATYKPEARDIVIETIVKGGVPREHITIIELTIDKIIKLRGLYYRTKRQAEQNGITMEETMKDHWEWEGDELTEEKYIKIMLAQEEKQQLIDFEPCPIAKKVDVSGRDITHCNNLDEALGLNRSDDWSYESICDKVLPLDKERDAEFIATGSMEEITKIWGELSPDSAIKEEEKDTEEVKELKQKRRSTIIQSKSWRDMDFSKLDLEDDE